MDATNFRGATLYRPLAVSAVGLLALAAWLLQHPFAGIAHDSLLYTLFALEKLHPDTLSTDVVVRFGSQGRFTFFTPIYTAAIQWLGVESAAAALLLLSEAGLLVCAWLLARRFMSRLDATLGIALLVMVPGEYGSGRIFHLLENFLTPRMPAEAMVIAAVLAALRERHWIAGGCIVAAVLLHPIMGAAGAAFLLLCFVVPLRPKLTLTVAAGGCAIALGIVVAIAPLGRLADPDWMHAIEAEVNYLFVSSWSLADWSRTAVPLALLAIGWRVAATPLLRRVCAGALGMVACGMAITLVFADLLHIWLFISLQAWRWLWLADVLALVLAPAILQDCWHRSDSGRIAVMVLATAWVFRSLTPDLLATTTAIALAVAPIGWGQRKYWRLLFVGACVLFGLSIGLTLTDQLSYVSLNDTDRDILFQQVRAVCSDGIAPATVSFLIWAALRRSTFGAANLRLALTLVLATAIFCAWLVPYVWKSYSGRHYTPELASRFAPWRAEIPPHAEVLWPETPLAAWYLLERANYWSIQQVAGGLFSKEQALIMEHRAQVVRTAMNGSNLLPLSGSPQDIETARKTMLPSNVSHMDLKAMTALCADPDLQYVVSIAPLTHTPFPSVSIASDEANRRMYLYRCADLRS